MRILLIGGTGTISSAITELLSARGTDEIWVLNRGKTSTALPDGVKQLVADAYDKTSFEQAIDGLEFDVSCHFVGFDVNQVIVAHDVLFSKVKQFIYISSASAYQKPPKTWLITEDVPLENPYWEYSRKKAECESYLMSKFHSEGFPVTIVRPSHTYCERSVPVGMHGNIGKSWTVLQRMIDGRPVIVHGDGTSLWAMTDSRDFAKAFVALFGNSAAIGQAFHITTDQSISWNEIYLDIAKALSINLKREVRPILKHVSSDMIVREGLKFGYTDLEGNLIGDKANSVVFDNSKIRTILPSFKAEITHLDGTIRAVNYILAHPELQQFDPIFDSFCDHLAAL